VSTSGFDVTVDAGEGFLGGWCARDSQTTISVPANTTATVELAWSLDAVFDPNTQSNRDLADEVRVDLSQNIDPEYPSTELFDVSTDGAGITDTTDRRRLGPSVAADSVSTDDLKVFQSITDPQGKTVTSLTDPVRVTEEAVTFTEPDVSVTQNRTIITNGSIEIAPPPDEIIADFEDGSTTTVNPDWDGFKGDIGSLTAQQSTVISGSFSAEFAVANDFEFISTQKPTLASADLNITVRAGAQNKNSDDFFVITIADSNTDELLGLRFDDGGAISEVFSGTTLASSWSASTDLKLRFEFDFSADTTAIFLNGKNLGTISNNASTTGYDVIEINNRTNASGTTRSLFIDDIIEIEAGAAITNADALIEFDSGVPTDINSYDLASFQRSPDTETVTVDVEDGTGSVLFSDIDRNFDISNVDTSKNVKIRANLARANGSNNPTFDFAARRFTR
jgi:hypothetical protein